MTEFWYTFLCQSIGIIATIFTIISFQFKKNKHLLICQLISTSLFTIQYGLSYAWAAMALNIVCAIRSLLFAFFVKENKKRSFLSFGFLVALVITVSTISVVYLNEKWYIALLIGLATIVGTFAIAITNVKFIRYAQLVFVSPCWLVNNIIYMSIGGIIAEVFNVISSIVFLIRIKKDKTNNQK